MPHLCTFHLTSGLSRMLTLLVTTHCTHPSHHPFTL